MSYKYADIDVDDNYFTIYGVRYDKNFFKLLATGVVGQSLRIIKREDGEITFQKLAPGSVVPGMGK